MTTPCLKREVGGCSVLDVTKRTSTSEIGQTAVEYAMVVGFVCILVVGILAASAPGWLTTLTGRVTTAIG